MSLDSIHHAGGTKFNVASQSCPGHQYPIDLNESTCDCKDFPRIRFCKHIAAIHEHFPQLCPGGSSRSRIPKHVHVSNQPKYAPGSAKETESVDTLLKNINALCQQLGAVSDRSTLDLKALRLIKCSLEKAIPSANGSRALPEKDTFNPNQFTWPEMINEMGAWNAPKWKHDLVDGNNTELRIGAVKGKRARKDTDGYAGGERSGKRAKPDAVSAAANELARAAMPAMTMQGPNVLAPACAPPSAAAAGFAACLSTCGNMSAAAPFAFTSASAAPGLAFTPLSAALLGHAFAPPSAVPAGFAASSSTRENPSTAVPFAFPLASAAPAFAFAPLSAASPGNAFAPPFTAGPGSDMQGHPPNLVSGLN